MSILQWQCPHFMIKNSTFLVLPGFHQPPPPIPFTEQLEKFIFADVAIVSGHRPSPSVINVLLTLSCRTGAMRALPQFAAFCGFDQRVIQNQSFDNRV
ncbi:MAG: hypothetical protein H7834_10555 [Magnetococcus sp. YQC-9]